MITVGVTVLESPYPFRIKLGKEIDHVIQARFLGLPVKVKLLPLEVPSLLIPKAIAL